MCRRSEKEEGGVCVGRGRRSGCEEEEECLWSVVGDKEVGIHRE